jgi:succinylglutamate desuccinylase
VLGLEEFVDGSLLGYLCDLGHVALAVEGGQHDDPKTVDSHEAAIWLTLEACGALPASQVPQRERHRGHLARAAARLPRVVEIRHRHPVRAEDAYVTLPGLANFSPVRPGQLLAHDRRGPIAAQEQGVVMLPLYQEQGEDGFFLARPVSRWWLGVSALLRRARLDRLVAWLPGVAADPDRPDHWGADPRVARFRTTEIFHLLGYRRVRDAGDRLLFSRRRPDRRGLGPIPPELGAVTTAFPAAEPGLSAGHGGVSAGTRRPPTRAR